MSKKGSDTKKPWSLQTKIIVLLAVLCAVLVLVLLIVDAVGAKPRIFRSTNYAYSMQYDANAYEYRCIRVDNQPTFMDRFDAIGAKEEFYISFIKIDKTVDLDEVLEAFQKEGDYSFDIEEKVVFGRGGYTATRISYTDDSGQVPVKVSYYYMLDRELLITTCTDASHREDIEEMLSNVELY